MPTMRDAYERYVSERFPLPSERQVRSLEQRINVIFPDDYRRFLLEYNGGYFEEPDIVPPGRDCPTDRLTFLSGIGASHPSAELGSDEDLSLFDNDPPQILPIGYTMMGNLLLLVTHPEGRGSILLKIASYDEYHLLASGISEFFDLLRDPSE